MKKINIKKLNFKKSMHYNPFAYVHDEKDILKLVTTLIANTKGEGKGGDEFWEKAEKLLYSALIGYIHYEAPEEEQNFSTLLEMINAMESKPFNAGQSGGNHPFRQIMLKIRIFKYGESVGDSCVYGNTRVK